MIAENSDRVALTAQGDIYRLYVKVIQPALAEFAPSVDVNTPGETPSANRFLEYARINTHNLLCYELRRTFALALGALFERQLQLWLSEKMPTKKADVEKDLWPRFEEFVNCVDASITKSPFVTDIKTLHRVANAVRHGNGPSAETLLKEKPEFWGHAGEGALVKRDLVGNMRISDAQLELYAGAIMRFWHLAGASPLPGQPLV